MEEYTQYATPQLGDNILAQIAATAREIIAAKLAVEEATEALQMKQRALAHLEETVMPEFMNEAGQQKLTTSDGLIVEIKDVLRGQPTLEKQSEAFAWLRENGQGSIIKSEIKADLGKVDPDTVKKVSDAMKEAGAKPLTKEAVHYQTLHSVVRELLGRGDSVPLELLGVTKQTKADVKAAKK